jgi:ABC-2 type transport system permease protein
MLFVRTTWLLFRSHLARVAWSKRSLACVLLAFLPALVAFLVAHFGRHVGPGKIATAVGFMLHLQVTLPLLALVAGSAAVAEEVEDRTITFLFSRPIPRAAVLLGRWAAIATFLTVLLTAAAWALLAAADHAHTTSPAIDAGIREPLYAATLAGGLVYSALFAALGVFVKNPVIVGLGYAFAVEGFLANMPAGTQALTIQFHLRSMVAALGSHAWDELEGFTSPHFDTLEGACWRLGGALVFWLAIAAWRIRTKQFVLNA